MEHLFDQLLTIRHAIAINAGYKNYRDYAHVAKARFSYTVEDIIKFHTVVENEVVPVLKLMNQQMMSEHDLKEFKPWDSKVEKKQKYAPYIDQNDFLFKCEKTLQEIKYEYGLHFNKMVNSGLLDIFNRRKKSPGSYNIPAFEMGASYIFANFIEKSGAYQDVAILHHEFGHALHNYFVT